MKYSEDYFYMINLCGGDLLWERPDEKIEFGSIHFSNGPVTCGNVAPAANNSTAKNCAEPAYIKRLISKAQIGPYPIDCRSKPKAIPKEIYPAITGIVGGNACLNIRFIKAHLLLLFSMKPVLFRFPNFHELIIVFLIVSNNSGDLVFIQPPLSVIFQLVF